MCVPTQTVHAEKRSIETGARNVLASLGGHRPNMGAFPYVFVSEHRLINLPVFYSIHESAHISSSSSLVLIHRPIRMIRKGINGTARGSKTTNKIVDFVGAFVG